MNKIFAIIVLATAVAVSGLPAFAQGSNQATDYALSWGAVGGYGSTYGNAYARYGRVDHPRRAGRYEFPSRAYGYAAPNSGTIPQSAIDFQEQGSH
jgi:hypothetical protein